MAAAPGGDRHARRTDELQAFLHVFGGRALRDGRGPHAVESGRIQPGRREVTGIGRAQELRAEGFGEGVEVGDLCGR